MNREVCDCNKLEEDCIGCYLLDEECEEEETIFEIADTHCFMRLEQYLGKKEKK